MKWFFSRPANCQPSRKCCSSDLTLELEQNVDRVDAGVDQVTEDKVDDAVLAAERHGRFGPLLGERIQTCTLSAGEHEREYSKLHLIHSWHISKRFCDYFVMEPARSGRANARGRACT